MDIYGLLKTDHLRAIAMLKELEALPEGSSTYREKLFRNLKHELEVHAHIEEEIFYSKLEGEKSAQGPLREAYREHATINQLLSELEDMTVDAELWSAKIEMLRAEVEHHVMEEEIERFFEGRKVFTDEQAEDMADRAEAMRKDMAA